MDREKTKSFKDLIVWQNAHQLVLSVYNYTAVFPEREMFGLTSQLRRSIVSVPANIVEGYKKKGKADKIRFMNIAQGSLEESRYYLILAQDLNYGDSSQMINMVEEVSKLIEAYSRAIRNSM
jgi:four helix bundle protein